MSEALQQIIDAAIGETRRALLREGRVIALEVFRASEEGRRARWGEVYAARIAKAEPRLRGAFVDLGLGAEQGFLRLNAHGKLGATAAKEGENIVVRVEREGARGKGPVLTLVETPHPGGAPRRIARHESDEDLESARPADSASRAQIDDAIEDCLGRSAGIPGGGMLSIEPTAALVAIDVDAGARPGGADGERFARELNIAAAQESARQIRLRGLGGIIAVDFASMRARENIAAVESAARAAFAGDPWGVQIGRISRFGVLELSRRQMRRPLHEILCAASGAESAETIALKALRAIERKAQDARG
ncbi:MAG: ribonuclease E/G, partial [Hyphomonadaceae bacterium]